MQSVAQSIMLVHTTPKRFKKTQSKKYNMDSTSIAQYIATLENRNSELLNENSELKEDQSVSHNSEQYWAWTWAIRNQDQ